MFKHGVRNMSYNIIWQHPFNKKPQRGDLFIVGDFVHINRFFKKSVSSVCVLTTGLHPWLQIGRPDGAFEQSPDFHSFI